MQNIKLFILAIILNLIAVAASDKEPNYTIIGKIDSKFFSFSFNSLFFKIDKGIQSLPFDSIHLNLIGADGYKKQGFVNFKGDFKIFVENPGIYKLEVF